MNTQAASNDMNKSDNIALAFVAATTFSAMGTLWMLLDLSSRAI